MIHRIQRKYLNSPGVLLVHLAGSAHSPGRQHLRPRFPSKTLIVICFWAAGCNHRANPCRSLERRRRFGKGRRPSIRFAAVVAKPNKHNRKWNEELLQCEIREQTIKTAAGGRQLSVFSSPPLDGPSTIATLAFLLRLCVSRRERTCRRLVSSCLICS